MQHCGLLLLLLATCFVTFSQTSPVKTNYSDAEELIVKASSKQQQEQETSDDLVQDSHNVDLNEDRDILNTDNANYEETTPMFQKLESFDKDGDEETSGDYDEIQKMEKVEFLQQFLHQEQKGDIKPPSEVDPDQQQHDQENNGTDVSEAEIPTHDSEVHNSIDNSTETHQEKGEIIPEPLPLFSNHEHQPHEIKGAHRENDPDGSSNILDEETEFPEEDNTQTSIVEAEGLFPVMEKDIRQEFENEAQPSYSGDEELENNSTDDPENSAYLSVPLSLSDSWSGDREQIESHASGDTEFTTNPLINQRLETVPTHLPTGRKADPNRWDHPPRPLMPPVINRLRCEDISCEKRHNLRVASSSLGGTVIPSDTVLTIRCTAYTSINDTAVITWHLPPRNVILANDSLTGDDESAVTKRINVTEDVSELRGKKERLTISTLRVGNVTEDDAGTYTCVTVLPDQCCHSNETVNIRVYSPPSYALDFAIVGAVCFVEFLIILYFKTRSNRNKSKAETRSNGFSSDYKPIPTNPSKDQKFEEVQQQLLT